MKADDLDLDAGRDINLTSATQKTKTSSTDVGVSLNALTGVPTGADFQHSSSESVTHVHAEFEVKNKASLKATNQISLIGADMVAAKIFVGTFIRLILSLLPIYYLFIIYLLFILV